MKHKLTAVIPTYNETHNIREVLESVKWADEILVVDSFSTDDTLDIAKEYTNFIIQREYENSASQKNWAIPQVNTEWILLVDADERITEELKNEIIEILSKDKIEEAGFWIYRINHFLGKKIHYSGWQGDKCIRLFQRDLCKYEEKHVHAEIIAKGKLGKLKSKMLHYSYVSLDHYFHKIYRYARWQAKDFEGKTPKVGFYHLFIKPFYRFIKHYFIRLGVLDGKLGFIISCISAWAVFLRYIYIIENRLKKIN